MNFTWPFSNCRKSPKEVYGSLSNWPLEELQNVIMQWEIHDLNLVTACLAEMKRRDISNGD